MHRDTSHQQWNGASMSGRTSGLSVEGALAALVFAASTLIMPAPIDATPTVPPQLEKATCSASHWSAVLLATVEDTGGGFADLPPCLPWSKGNCVTINGPCFALDSGCGSSFKPCAESADCRKGMSCIARCGGDPTCTTGCFAAFGDDKITDFLGCALEGKKCLDFPKDPKLLGWLDDGPNAPKKVSNFDINSLKGDWIKVLGLDERYDCFECQQNRFRVSEDGGGKWRMDTTFRLPRMRGPTVVAVEPPLAPNTFSWDAASKTPDVNYYQNDLTEEVFVDAPDAKPTMHTTGKTFGLTFWENYYIVGQGSDWQFVRYVGHTLQGGYKGAFVLSKSGALSEQSMAQVRVVAAEQGINLNDFCKVKNQACATRSSTPQDNDLDDYFGDANKHVNFLFSRQEKLGKTK